MNLTFGQNDRFFSNNASCINDHQPPTPAR